MVSCSQWVGRWWVGGFVQSVGAWVAGSGELVQVQSVGGWVGGAWW